MLWAGDTTENRTAHGDVRDVAKLARRHRITAMLSREAADFLNDARQIVNEALTPPFSHRHLRKFKV